MLWVGERVKGHLKVRENDLGTIDKVAVCGS